MTQPLNVRQKLRAAHVKRWHIMEVARRQSVAEHSFNVMLITEEFVGLIGAGDKFRQQCREYALFHDITEVVLGDMPTPVKAFMGDVAMMKVADAEKSILPQSFPESVCNVVKLADLLEAVLFLASHGVGKHAQLVRDDLVDMVWQAFDRLPTEWRSCVLDFVRSVVSWDTANDSGEGVTWYKK